MERNPLIVVSSRLDRGESKGRGGSNGDVPPIISAWRRAQEADVGNTIVDCHNLSVMEVVQDSGAYCVGSDLSDIPQTHNYKPPSGLARVAQTVTKFDRFCNHDLIIHMPEHYADIDAKYLRALMYPLAASEVGMATLVAPLDPDQPEDTPKASVVWNDNRKVYVMPEAKVGTIKNFSRSAQGIGDGEVYTHIPVYLYRRSTLDRIVRMPPSSRELEENIESLRVLDLGMRVEALYVPEGVPTSMKDNNAIYD
jgi:3-deoxy-manno-octulosonate cytidylyltransferase (CMP-KDO synthetase)